MGLFKSKEERDKEKAVKEIKEKQKKLDTIEKEEKRIREKIEKEKLKVKEEIRKMAKLAIKDGKLQPVEDMPPQAEPRQTLPLEQPFPEMPPERPPQMPPPQMPPHIPPPMPPQQPQMPQAPPIAVQVVLSDKTALTIEVPAEHINNFIERISESMNDQSTFQVGNRVINGRHIMHYSIVQQG